MARSAQPTWREWVVAGWFERRMIQAVDGGAEFGVMALAWTDRSRCPDCRSATSVLQSRIEGGKIIREVVCRRCRRLWPSQAESSSELAEARARHPSAHRH